MLSTWGKFTAGAPNGSSLNLNLAFPTGGTLDKRITFSRGSNATLTGSNGLIQYAPHNLLTYSEQFDNAAWTKTRSSISANAILSPTGTLTADKLVEDTTASNTHYTDSATTTATASVVYTASFYAKAGERTRVVGYIVDTGIVPGTNTTFDLSTGTIVTGSQASIQSVGNGWYRCTVYGTISVGATTARLRVMLDNGSGTVYTGDGVSGAYIWGAQLNVGALQPYNTTTVKNLLGFTQEFNNAAWTKSGATVATDVTTAPDGSLTADKLTEDTSSGSSHRVGEQIVADSTATYTGSCYVKAAGRTWARVYIDDNSGNSCTGYVNLTTGAIGSAVNGGTGSGAVVFVQDAGNGWYRCSIKGKPSTVNTTAVRFQVSGTTGDNVPSYTGDGVSGIYIWGAQLSDSASLEPYVYNPVAAPSAAAYYGPRFDYDPVTLQPKGLLVEEQRTNLYLYSEQLDNTGTWIQSGVTVTANATTAPDGNTTADKVIPTAVAGTFKEMQQNVASVTLGTTYTLSCFVKSAGYQYIQLIGATAGFGTFAVNYDLSNGTETAFTAGGSTVVGRSITPYGNGWYRVSVSVTALATGSSRMSIDIIPAANSARGVSWAGDGTSGIYQWGAQFEAGTFPTSYIPTTSAQATRNADVATMVGANFSNWYNASEGTLYGEIADSAVVVSGASRRIANINNGTENYKITIAWAGSTGTGTAYITDASVTQANFVSPSGAYPFPTKVALAYKVNDINAAVNGSAFTTDTSGTIPVVDRMTIGDVVTGGTGPQNLNGHIKRIAYYQRRLSNSELQSITS